VTVTETTKRNAAAPESPGAGGPGVINDASASINEFGLFDTRLSVRTAVEKSVTDNSGGPLVTVTETTKRNAAGPENPGPGAVGTIKDASASINEFGLFDTRLSVRTASFYAVLAQIVHSDGSKDLTVTFRNASLAEVQSLFGSYGQNSQAIPAFGINEFGLCDGQIRFVPLRDEFHPNFDFEEESSEVVISTVEIGGVYYKRTVTSTFTMKRGWGITSAVAEYSGAKNGSSFNVLGPDTFEYKKVTKIEVSHSAVADPTADVEW
jgi:hypothetical protein